MAVSIDPIQMYNNNATDCFPYRRADNGIGRVINILMTSRMITSEVGTSRAEQRQTPDSMSSRMASRSAGTTSSRIIAPHSPGLHY